MEELILKEYRVEREIAGRKLCLSTGLIAKQAAGAVMVQYGETVVFTAVTCSPPRFEDSDFFPLMVDYREKTYAAGKFPGGFFKREKAPSTKETLTMRLTDRPIRPLFPKGYRNDVIVQSLVMSADHENEPDILSIIGAGAACSLSTMPFDGPLGAVRVGMVDGKFVANPTHAEMKVSSLNLVMAGTADSICMVEAGALQISEDKMLEALNFGHEVIKTVVEMVNELREKSGRTEVEPFEEPALPACLPAVRAAAAEKLKVAVCTPGKFGRRDASALVCAEVVADLARPEDEGGLTAAEVKECLGKVKTEVIRDLIKSNKRLDGRDLYTVRPIDCRLGILPQTHGSSLFTRGETQALVIVTLGTTTDTQRVDGLRQEYEESWYLHYQAPGFSVGESRAPRGPGRRDIGHGMLGQRALEAVMPKSADFPYTVRAVSEIMEMNGSSSMATVCGATLALMDAGVPIAKPVAGIAMGLIQDAGEEPVVITDILGDEDHYGDMDFKVCGTDEGITALQMDIKIKGISTETMRKALAQARDGRLHILNKITSCIPAPRGEISGKAPRLHQITIDSELVGKIIGPGGKTIRSIQEGSGAQIDIDDSAGPGVITICAPDVESLQKAVSMVESLTATAEINKTYEGRVTSIREFGIFVEILPGTEGMCHVSELSDGFIKEVEEVCQVGDIMKVKVIGVDDMGKVRISRKAVILEERGEVYTAPPPPARRSGGGRGDDRRGGRPSGRR
jgi:polyribonucleotide nucleotidyltransferase